MTKANDHGDEQFSQLLSVYEEAIFSGLGSGGAPVTDSANAGQMATHDASIARRLMRTKRCLRLLDEVWPRADQPHRLASEPANEGLAAGRTAPLCLLAQRIDRFEIASELGRGGFGIVYLADDPKLGREVALKVQRPETVLSGELRRRFLREAKTAAILSHPNIVAVYDAEVTGVQCWIASEYCRGTTLKDWLSRRAAPVSPRAAVELVLSLAEAASYAHTRGVLHRDIKPSNVLLQIREDAAPNPNGKPVKPVLSRQDENDLTTVKELPEYVPKLADFGLARIDDESGDETRSGAQLGTPAYMAPEQIEGNRARIDRRTDVYGLGVLLYELLTGRMPFEGQTRTDTLTQVLLREPPRPRQLRGDLPRDLEAIVLRCLEKRPERRYASALLLANDLRRFLNDEPTSARPLAAWEVLGKWSRRHPALALLLAVVIVGLPIVTAIIAGKNADLSAALEQAQRNEKDATAQRHLAEAGEHRKGQTLYALRMRTAWEAYSSDDLATMDEMLKPYDDERYRPEFCGFEYAYLRNLRQRGPRTLLGHRGQTYCVAFSPDGALLASGAEDHTVKLWNPATGECLATLAGHQDDVNCVAFSPDGDTLASASDDGSVGLWNVKSRSLRVLLKQHEDNVVAAKFSPNGRWLVSGDNSGVVIVWDVESGQARTWLQRHSGRIENLDVSGDNRLILTGGEEHVSLGVCGASARVWDLEQRKETWAQEFYSCSVQCVAFDPVNDGYFVGDAHGNLTIWNRVGKQTGVIDYGSDQIKTIALSRDGSIRAVAGETKGIIVDRNDPAWPRSTALHGHRSTVWDLAISPDGATLASASRDGTVKLWNVRQDPRYGFTDCGLARKVRAVDMTGTHIARLGDTPDTVEVESVGSSRVAQPAMTLPSGTITSVALGSRHPWLAIGSSATSVMLFDYERHCQVGRLPRPGPAPDPNSLKFSGDDRMFCTVDSSKARVWDISDIQRPRLGVEIASGDPVFSRDGNFLAVFFPQDPRIDELWRASADGWQKAWTIAPRIGSPPAFTYDGRTVAIGDLENTVHIRETTGGAEIASFKVPSIRGSKIAVSPNGATVASYANRRLKTWSVPTGMQVIDLALPIDADRIEFAPDGSALILTGISCAKSEVARNDRPSATPIPAEPDNPTRYAVIVLPAEAGRP